MAAQTKTKEVTKAVMCSVTGEPIATVKVPASVRAIKLAGAYTANGDAVNVSANKVTANAGKLACFHGSAANYHEKSGTYYIEVTAVL